MQLMKIVTMVTLACGALAAHADTVTPATLVLVKGKVQTMDERRSWAQSVAVRGNLIVAVGSDAEIAAYIGPATRVIDLQGKSLLPGFIDGHVHPALGSERLGKCSVGGAAMSVAEIADYVRAHCPDELHPASPDKWIEVVNVNPANFVATARDLDQISSTQPVILGGADAHTSWVNSIALRIAKIGDDTRNPTSGEIERDAQGHATGFLKDTAQDLVTNAMPKPAMADCLRKLNEALTLLRSKGVTSVQDALATEDALDLYDSLEQSDQLKMRVRAMLASSVVHDETEYRRLFALRSRFSGHRWIRADGVKILSDGVIEYPTQTAAMLHPYLDGKGHPGASSGGRFFEVPVLNRYVARLDKEGFTVFVHSIGDYTTHAALNAFEAARKKNGWSDNRHAITHLQIVDKADFPRFSKLGVYANMQLFWALPSEYSVEALKPYISAENFRYMYPAASLKAAGATIYGGSDWPVDAMPGDPMPNTPLSATQTGLLRMDLEPESKHKGEVLNAAERLDLDTMLAAYTITAAKAMKQEHTTGSIEVGKLADLVVLDSDVKAAPPASLSAIKVRYTILDGTVVYELPELDKKDK
jgi:predicted amidohydrolase YtcJ